MANVVFNNGTEMTKLAMVHDGLKDEETRIPDDSPFLECIEEAIQKLQNKYKQQGRFCVKFTDRGLAVGTQRRYHIFIVDLPIFSLADEEMLLQDPILMQCRPQLRNNVNSLQSNTQACIEIVLYSHAPLEAQRNPQSYVTLARSLSTLKWIAFSYHQIPNTNNVSIDEEDAKTLDEPSKTEASQRAPSSFGGGGLLSWCTRMITRQTDTETGAAPEPRPKNMDIPVSAHKSFRAYFPRGIPSILGIESVPSTSMDVIDRNIHDGLTQLIRRLQGATTPVTLASECGQSVDQKSYILYVYGFQFIDIESKRVIALFLPSRICNVFLDTPSKCLCIQWSTSMVPSIGIWTVTLARPQLRIIDFEYTHRDTAVAETETVNERTPVHSSEPVRNISLAPAAAAPPPTPQEAETVDYFRWITDDFAPKKNTEKETKKPMTLPEIIHKAMFDESLAPSKPVPAPLETIRRKDDTDDEDDVSEDTARRRYLRSKMARKQTPPRDRPINNRWRESRATTRSRADTPPANRVKSKSKSPNRKLRPEARKTDKSPIRTAAPPKTRVSRSRSPSSLTNAVAPKDLHSRPHASHTNTLPRPTPSTTSLSQLRQRTDPSPQPPEWRRPERTPTPRGSRTM